MKMQHGSALAALLLAVSLTAAAQVPASPPSAPAATAAAPGTFDATHPRRAEVNARLANQNARIAQERQSGQISKAQATALHAQDHAIRTEERTDAKADGGHITKSEQRSINHQENGVSREIGK